MFTFFLSFFYLLYFNFIYFFTLILPAPLLPALLFTGVVTRLALLGLVDFDWVAEGRPPPPDFPVFEGEALTFLASFEGKESSVIERPAGVLETDSTPPSSALSLSEPALAFVLVKLPLN